MKNAKNLMMMLALVMTVMVSSCDEKANEDIAPQEQAEDTGNTNNSRLRMVGSDTYDTSNMDEWSEVTIADLPQSAQDHLTANYADIALEEGYRTDTGEFVILLENDMVVVFNADGAVIIEFDLSQFFDDDDHDDDDEDFDEVPLDSLPQAIKDYVAANYAGATIEEAYQCPDNDHYIVFLDNDIALEFDGQGNFVGVFEEDDDDDDDWEDGLEEIAADSLPQAIKDYLAANYAGIAIEEAAFDTVEELYYVLLENDLIIVFDKDGNFVEELNEDDWEDDDDDGEDDEWEDDYEEVNPNDLPQAIKDYVATNYPNNTIVEAYFSEEDGEYYVVLDDDTCLIFDKDGNFVEVYEDDEDDDDGEDDDDDDDEGEG